MDTLFKLRLPVYVIMYGYLDFACKNQMSRLPQNLLVQYDNLQGPYM